MMNKMKKLFVLVLVVGIVSLGLTGCEQKGEQPAEGTASSEHPTEEVEVVEVEVVEVPAEEIEVVETESEEHPAGEHPTGEHPQ